MSRLALAVELVPRHAGGDDLCAAIRAGSNDGRAPLHPVVRARVQSVRVGVQSVRVADVLLRAADVLPASLQHGAGDDVPGRDEL
jgi:hypothetical protein